MRVYTDCKDIATTTVCVSTCAFRSCAVGWGRDYRNEGFGDQNGIKHQLVTVITAVQTLLRGECVLTNVTADVSVLENIQTQGQIIRK